MASQGPTLLPTGSVRSDLETGGYERAPLGGYERASGFAIDGNPNPGLPNDRPTHRRRVAFLAALGILVVSLMVAVVVVGAGHPSNGSDGKATSSASGSDSDSGGGAGSSPAPQEGGRSLSPSVGYPVTFFAIGDWGRQGGNNQSEVADLMGRVAEVDAPQFVVSVGDNFYPHGLSSTGDSLFAESFSDVYTAAGLKVPWHAVLGNHDYCDSATKPSLSSPIHQLNMSLSNRDSRWHCERSYTESYAGGSVQIFYIDTSPFILRYQKEKWAKCPGGILQQSWQAQLLELEQRLSRSTAAWKLAVGHHPTYSSGEHGNNTEIIQHLEPLFQRYGVQAYFAGHDHNLEALPLENYTLIVTGGGSKTQREEATAVAGSEFYHPYSGFVSVSIAEEEMAVEFYTLEGGEVPAHTTTIPRQAAGLGLSPAF